MSRVCELTGIRVLSGNNVSHSQRKTRRRFLPNLHNVTLYSEALSRGFKFRVVARALRTIEASGGLDSFLLSAKKEALSKNASDVRKLISLKKQAAA
ncbi:MAG: 50S ribosomal protein L28 [Rickettsiaceae bacterium]|nr:50S ribosomal protein L28 [Rickettsiaceae bacterium]